MSCKTDNSGKRVKVISGSNRKNKIGNKMLNLRARSTQNGRRKPQQQQEQSLPELQHQEQEPQQPQRQQQEQQLAAATTQQKEAMSADERKATKKSVVSVVAIFATSLLAMFYVYAIFPELNATEKQHLKIPRDIEDAKMLAKVLDRYKDMYYFEVMFGVVVAYVFGVTISSKARGKFF